MSLTRELDNPSSQASLFFKGHLPDTRNFGKVWKDLICDLPCYHPPKSQENPEYTTIGTAIDYRIRLYLQPYLALKTKAYKGAKAKFGQDNTNSENYFEKLWKELSAIWDSLSKEYGGRKEFKNDDIELRISTICLVFAYFEEIFRSRNTPDILILASKEKWRAENFLKKLRQTTVDDICQLSKLFIQNGSKIISTDTVVLNPVFVGSRDVGSADADLITGDCLWDIKTTISPEKKFQKWPYQLLGYSFLDYEDEFKIKSVGIYLSRQGACICWSLEDLIKILGGDTEITVDQWRTKFRKSLKQ